MNTAVGFALLLSTLAGLSTILGCLLGICVRRPGPRFMSFVLGFSAGVMILVSFVELLQDGIETNGAALAYLAFFGGMGVMFLIDTFVPHRYVVEHRSVKQETRQDRLLHTGLLVALGIAIHNFPEGIATFTSTLENRSLGIAIAIAIALHNIPEGLGVSAPIYAATGSRAKALWWSFLAGAAEPLGALLAALILTPFLNQRVLGFVLPAVAGIMVFISLDELVPVACSFGQEHMSILGVTAGMAIMAFSLWVVP